MLYVYAIGYEYLRCLNNIAANNSDNNHDGPKTKYTTSVVPTTDTIAKTTTKKHNAVATVVKQITTAVGSQPNITRATLMQISQH